jgi:hypothetical protein
MRSGVPEVQAGTYPGAVFKRVCEPAVSAKKGRIDPAVKSWLDNVLVPALVRLYLAANGREEDNGLVPITERVQ